MDFINAIIELSNAMSPYLLFGFFIAGILHEYLPEDFIKKHLGKKDIYSVIKATIFGIPLPICSCGVIPLATSIQKNGASKGSVLSFLISTPITGVDSILATYGFFGWIFTIYRVFSSIILALVAGILENIFDKNDTSIKQKNSIFLNNPKNIQFNFQNNQKNKKIFSLKSAMKYGFITLFQDIAKPLFWGIIIGAIITVAVPKELSEILNNYYFLSYILAILIAVPMYVCATASLPIAAALILNGVSLGAAFVFLTAGPATNTVTIGVVKKMIGKRGLFIYLFTIILGSLIFGLGLDLIFKDIEIKELMHIEKNYSFIENISSIIMWSFILYFLLKDKLTKKSCCR